jgi:hypothetical protein
MKVPDYWTKYLMDMKALHGLRPSKRVPCPRNVAGIKHLGWGHNCICDQFRDLLDHAHSWRDLATHMVVTGEPYHAPKARIEEFRKALHPMGLLLTVNNESPWYPGRTKFLRIDKDPNSPIPLRSPGPWTAAVLKEACDANHRTT